MKIRDLFEKWNLEKGRKKRKKGKRGGKKGRYPFFSNRFAL